MVGPWPPSLKLLHGFSMKAPSSSSSTSNPKFKTLIHTFLFSYSYRITRVFSKFKSVFLRIITKSTPITFINHGRIKTSKIINNKKKNKILFGSFRLHYNWSSSSHVTPVPALEESFYYDSTWNSFISTDCNQSEESSKLSGYLQWLEERKPDVMTGNFNEIDQLADIFIANCHEKFQLEKQESYRKFQEMLSRSM